MTPVPVVVGGQIGDGALVGDAAIGLAVEVAGVGIPAVGAQPGHGVRAGGHRLGLELLESPRLALRAGTAQAAPTGRRLVGHHAGDVLLEGHAVDGARGAVGVVGGLDVDPGRSGCRPPGTAGGPWRRCRGPRGRVGRGHRGGICTPVASGAPRPAAARTDRGPRRLRPGSMSTAWPPAASTEVPATENAEPEVTITVLPSFSVMATRRPGRRLRAVQRAQRGAPVEVVEDRLVRGCRTGRSRVRPTGPCRPRVPSRGPGRSRRATGRRRPVWRRRRR